MTKYYRKAFFSFAWITIGVVIADIFGYLFRLLLARNLTVEEYGLVYAVIALFGLSSIFVHLGLTEGITRYVAAYAVRNKLRETKEIILWAIGLLYTSTAVVCVIGFLAADWLGRVYFKHSLAHTLIQIFVVSLLLSPFGNIAIAILRGRQRMDLRALYEVAHNVIVFVAAALFLSLGYGAKGAMYAYVVSRLAMYVIFIPVLAKTVLPGFFVTKAAAKLETARLLMSYSLPVMLTSIAGVVLTYTDTALLTIFSTVRQVGIYQAALPTAKLLLFLVVVISTALLPLVAELWEKKEKELIKKGVEDLYLYAFVGIVPLVLVMVIYPDAIVSFLFGKEYASATPILRILALAAFFLVLNAITGATLSGIGVPKKNTKAVFLGAGINFVSNLVLIPSYGGVGAAISTLFSAVIIFWASTSSLYTEIGVRVPFFKWLRVMPGAIVFVLALLLSRRSLIELNHYVELFIVIGGGVVYFVLIPLTGAIATKDLLYSTQQLFSSPGRSVRATPRSRKKSRRMAEDHGYDGIDPML